jgi:hypothetical protein
MPLYDFRYVSVECENDELAAKEQKVKEMYLCIMKRFSQALLRVREVPPPPTLKRESQGI